jgi:hypothetical protein
MAIEKGDGPASEASSRTARHPDTRDGVVGSFWALSLGMVESSVRTAAGLGRTLTGESQKLGEALIQFNEQGFQALTRTARKLNDSSFGLLTDVVNRLESGALVVISHGQQTSDRVAELAAQASHAAVGSRGVPASARA